MKNISLNGCWQGGCVDAKGTKKFEFTGTVPGCVHTDLAGKHIPEDIFYRNNTDECQWIEDCDWYYTRVFTLDEAPEKAQLVFEGLDTYADIYLNDILIGSADNMFIPHSFDVAGILNKGDNTISVRFRSPIREVEGLENREGRPDGGFRR